MYVCKNCGSDNIFRDALVAVNDPKDVRTFDSIICDDCGKDSALLDDLKEVG